MPTEPTNPLLEGQLPVHDTTSPEAEPDLANVVIAGPDLDGGQSQEKKRRRKKNRGKRRGESRPQRIEQGPSVGTKAAYNFYNAKQPELYAALFQDKPSTEPAEPLVEGAEALVETTDTGVDPEDVTKWSYRAYRKQVAEDYLLKDGDHFGTGQKLTDHQDARSTLRESIYDRFEADQQRIHHVLNELEAAYSALTDDTQKADFDKAMIGRAGRKEKPLAIREKVKSYYGKLEKERWILVMDMVDWFEARIKDVEDVMKNGTVRKSAAADSLPQRLRFIDTDPNLQKMLAELAADMKFFTELQSLTMSDSWVQGKMAKQIGNGVSGEGTKPGRAKVMMDKLARRIGDLKNLTELRDGKDKLQAAEARVADQVAIYDVKDRRVDFRPVGKAFMDAARQQAIGLSPDQEVDYWDAIKEMIEEAVPYDKSRSAADQMNMIINKLHLFEVTKGVGTEYKLKRNQTPMAPDQELPDGFDQLVGKAKIDAELLGKVRVKMNKTYAIMGSKFTNQLRRSLGHHAVAAREDMVDTLNRQIDGAQGKAIAALSGRDETFKTDLAGRLPSKLARTGRDKELSALIRTEVFAQMNLGTPEDPDKAAVGKLLKPQDAEDQTARQDQEREAELELPYLEAIAKGDMFEDTTSLLAEAVREAAGKKEKKKVPEIAMKARNLKGMLGRIAKGDKALQTAIIKAMDVFKPTDENALYSQEGVGEFLDEVSTVLTGLDQLRSLFGETWAADVGLSLVDPADAAKRLVQTDVLSRAFNNYESEDGNIIDAMYLSKDPSVITALLRDVEPVLRAKFNDEFGLDAAHLTQLLLDGAPKEPKAVKKVDINAALSELASQLELPSQDGTVKGQDLLLAANLSEMKPVEGSTDGATEPVWSVENIRLALGLN